MDSILDARGVACEGSGLMTAQLDLIDIGDRDILGLRGKTVTATPHPVGSGPATETCGTCAHRAKFHQSKRWLKCAQAIAMWTKSEKSDKIGLL